MIQLNRMDEDRTFSLNLTFTMKQNMFEESIPPSKEKLLRYFDAQTIQSLIRKGLKRNDIRVFTYNAEVSDIHEYNRLERQMGAYQMMEYRITLKVETVINYGGNNE